MKLVLLRHGESTWNKSNQFTGWTDVDLTPKGVEEARQAGQILKSEGYIFDVAFTSVLLRATKTLDIVLKEMNLKPLIHKSWRLNERHYGALQGLNKAETAKKYGETQVHLWRRSYDVRPPALDKTDSRYLASKKYKVPEADLPLNESLKDTVARFLPYWHESIAPVVKSGKQVIISASGNSLRALVKHLDGISDKDISEVNIPTGVPLVYELNDNLKPIRHYYLGDEAAITKKMLTVKSQGKAK